MSHNSSSNPTEPPSINPPVEVANIPNNPKSPNTHNLPNSSVPNNTEEIQPDAEPDANSQPSTPTPNNQDENNNPHPSPYPLHDLPNTIPRGGLDVSVPDTDEGENSLLAREMTQDHWEIKKGKVIRHHVLPRSRMFNPVSLDDIPVPLELLEPQRTTHVTPRNGPSWKHQDLWRGDIQGHQSLPVIWTGHTDFEIRSEFLTQCPTQQQYINMCADQPTWFWTEITRSLILQSGATHCQILPNELVIRLEKLHAQS